MIIKKTIRICMYSTKEGGKQVGTNQMDNKRNAKNRRQVLKLNVNRKS